MKSYNQSEEFEPYTLPIKDVVKRFHVSEFFLRQGIKNGTIKHMRSGKKIYIHVPALKETLDALCHVSNN